MSKLVKQTEDALHTLVVEALGKAIAAGELPAAAMPSFIVEIPQDRANGDYSTNAAFVGAKVFRMAPVKIAQVSDEEVLKAVQTLKDAGLNVTVSLTPV